MERLHHIFADIPNVQVILSIDKSQLEHTIQKTFGSDTETQHYLSKFINFEVNLGEGSFTIQEEFENKFDFYLQQFEYINEATKNYQVDEFKTEVFDGIDMRSRIEIIEKCNLLHRMLNEDDKPCDFSIMCIEIFMVLISQQGLEKHEISLNKATMFKGDAVLPVGIANLEYKMQEEHDRGLQLWSVLDGKRYCRANDILSLIYTAHKIRKSSKDVIVARGYDLYDISKVKKYVKDFQDLLDVIN